jgi:glycerophosphoryl diester phosphodiesterase
MTFPFRDLQKALTRAGEKLRRHRVLLQTLPWARSDAAVYWRLMDLDVASFATDHPDKTMDAIRQYYSAKRRD